MDVVAAIEAIALIVVATVMLHDKARAERAWTEERRELLTRIQRPDYIPVTAPEHFVVPDSEPDELELVGTIAEPLNAEGD